MLHVVKKVVIVLYIAQKYMYNGYVFFTTLQDALQHATCRELIVAMTRRHHCLACCKRKLTAKCVTGHKIE